MQAKKVAVLFIWFLLSLILRGRWLMCSFLCRLMIFEPHTVPMDDCCETVTVQYITAIVIYL